MAVDVNALYGVLLWLANARCEAPPGNVECALRPGPAAAAVESLLRVAGDVEEDEIGVRVAGEEGAADLGGLAKVRWTGAPRPSLSCGGGRRKGEVVAAGLAGADAAVRAPAGGGGTTCSDQASSAVAGAESELMLVSACC